MNLPTSRNTTYAAETPIKSADLNALQDMIIGAKYPAITIPIPASSWRSEGGGGGWSAGQATFSVGNGKWTWAGFDDIVYGLVIPVGTRLTSVKFNYNRTGGTLNFKVRKRLTAAGAWTDVVTGADNATAGVAVKTLNCAEVIVADTQYMLYIDSSGVATFDVADYTIDRL